MFIVALRNLWKIVSISIEKWSIDSIMWTRQYLSTCPASQLPVLYQLLNPWLTVVGKLSLCWQVQKTTNFMNITKVNTNVSNSSMEWGFKKLKRIKYINSVSEKRLLFTWNIVTDDRKSQASGNSIFIEWDSSCYRNDFKQYVTMAFLIHHILIEK